MVLRTTSGSIIGGFNESKRVDAHLAKMTCENGENGENSEFVQTSPWGGLPRGSAD